MRKKKQSAADTFEGAAGTYVYDHKLGRVVKVSDRIPRVSARGRCSGSDSDFESSPETESPEAGPCGMGPCSGGPCAGGFDGI